MAVGFIAELGGPASFWLGPVCQLQSGDSGVMLLVVADQNRPHRQRVTCNEGIELPNRSSRTGKSGGNLAKCRGRNGVKWQYLHPGEERVDRLMDLSRLAIVSSVTKLGNGYRT